ncbi:MAG: hypothetical protein IJ193_05785 [Bacilli bacterium]|nr:hypothetical protein [Bacilli bacterium]
MMKAVGEITFDVFYLVFVGLIAYFLLRHCKKGEGKMMGYATLFLVVGDAFHLIPRILDYLFTYDFTFLLGFGKMVTSFTMTFFYVFLYWIYFNLFHEKENIEKSYFFYALVVCRLFFLVLPMNHWFSGEGSVWMGITRNIPFVIMGVMVLMMYYKRRKRMDMFSRFWIYILLSFLFYLPVVVFAKDYPIIGMFMLPKTVCYILMVNCFFHYCLQYCIPWDDNDVVYDKKK